MIKQSMRKMNHLTYSMMIMVLDTNTTDIVKVNVLLIMGTVMAICKLNHVCTLIIVVNEKTIELIKNIDI